MNFTYGVDRRRPIGIGRVASPGRLKGIPFGATERPNLTSKTELIIKAGAHQTLSVTKIKSKSRWDGARRRAGSVTEVDKKVLNLSCPVPLSNGYFDSGTSGPTDFCSAIGNAICHRLHIAVCGAACEIKERPVNRVACSPTRRTQPSVLSFTSKDCRTGAAGTNAAVDVRPVEVGLDPDHKPPDLKIYANSAASGEAGHIERARKASRRPGPAQTPCAPPPDRHPPPKWGS